MNKSKNEVLIKPQYLSGCGLDMHKDKISAYYSDNKGEDTHFEEFGTFTKDLKLIVKLLKKKAVAVILMESTGVYWISLYHMLVASGFNVIVANPYHIQQMPKQKTDKKDAKWLCKLAINNMVKRSVVPSSEQHELREYCRLREKYEQQMTQCYNRTVKILERGNYKLRSVSSSIRTKSCQLIISSIIEGQRNPKVLAQLCKGRLRNKIQQMELALEGKLTGSDLSILKLIKGDIKHFENQLEELESSILKLIDKHYKADYELLKKISGVGVRTSQSILSEAGNDMSKYPNGDHLTAWSGLAPGNNESAGKRKNSTARKGNKHLKTTMIRVAWSAVRTKDSYWGCKYAKLKKRMKAQKAIVAIARRMLKLIYKIILEQTEYIEGGSALFIQQQRRSIEYKQRLESTQ